MVGLSIASQVLLWLAVLFLGFCLLGALRTIGILTWRIEQMAATAPRRIGRDGLPRGTRAPEFTLPAGGGREVSLSDFRGKRVLLAFVQLGCSPCHGIVPELNRLQRRGELHVLVINRGSAWACEQWARQWKAEFPVLAQTNRSVSSRYEAVATPFAFLINEAGLVVDRGVVAKAEHLNYLLANAEWQINEPPGSELSDQNKAEELLDEAPQPELAEPIPELEEKTS